MHACAEPQLHHARACERHGLATCQRPSNGHLLDSQTGNRYEGMTSAVGGGARHVEEGVGKVIVWL